MKCFLLFLINCQWPQIMWILISGDNLTMKCTDAINYNSIFRVPLCRHPVVISLSVHLSFRPFVCPRSLVLSISSLPVAHSGSYITHRVPVGNRCALTLNKLSRSNVKAIAEFYEKSLSGG